MSFENPVNEPVKDPSSERAVARYRAFVDALHPKTGIIYYPSCAQDVTVSAAFPGSRVVYVDIDQQSIADLRSKGFEAHRASASDEKEIGGEIVPPFVLDQKADVLILLNPGIDPTKSLENVAPGGYILCNDYHGTASDLHQRNGLKLVGILRVDPAQKKFILDTESPEDYWRSIESDEEYKNVRVDPFGACPYDRAAKVVQKVLGSIEGVSVAQEYKRIYEEAQLKDQKMREEMLGEPVQVDDIVGIHVDGAMLVLNRLPRKKGGVDDLFVFQKV